MQIRPATPADADGMSLVLEAITASTGRTWTSSPEELRRDYVEHPDRVTCCVAVSEGGVVLGFQSLKRVGKGNPYEVEPGWGVIGTHVSPPAARRGVGTALFAASCRSAREAGLAWIDATIARGDPVALGYYEAMGFRTYRTSARATGKRYEVGGPA
jgi:ribosomal protein S18 acetylase RimI-like enzyme